MENGENEELETINEESQDEETSDNDVTNADNVTYQDYLALLERNKKAEAKLVELKKNAKETVKTAPAPKIDTELRLFLVENPEAKEYKEQILEYKNNPKYKDFELEELLDLAKVKTPPQSKTKTEYDFRSLRKPKTLETMSEDEAIEKLNPKDFLAYQRLHGAKV